jgi:MAF protein
MKLILGSSSIYRKAAMERLGLSFECISPDIDESPFEHEQPEHLVERLSREKALAISQHKLKDKLIISSDQVAVHQGDILGKPGTVERAIEQLTRFSGDKVTFITGLAILNSNTQELRYQRDITEVHFKQLSEHQIKRYIEREQPLNAAGSFKSEGLGIALFDKIDNEDPSALVGLPLIALVKLLEAFDYPIL